MERATPEFFSILANETEIHLQRIWDEVGLGEEERRRQLDAMMADVEAVFKQKITEEEGIQREYVEEVSRLKGSIKQMVVQMEIENSELPLADSQTIMGELKSLRAHHAELDRIYQDRMAGLVKSLTRVHSLYRELGTPFEDGFEEIGGIKTDARAGELDAKFIELESEKAMRIDAMHSTVVDVIELLEELEVAPTGDLDAVIVRDKGTCTELGVRMEAVEAVSRRARELTDEKLARRERLKQLGEKVQPLWAMLEVSETTRQEFFEENTGLGMRVVERCEEELRRLLELKCERLGELIAKCREEIESLWDSTGVSLADRAKFIPQMQADQESEDLLEAHEEILKGLRARHSDFVPLLKEVRRHNQIFLEREQYDSMVLDSSRLLSRKPGSQRRAEEQQRKRVAGLPKLTGRLRAAIESFEIVHGTYTFEGKPFLSELISMHERYDNSKREKKERKARLGHASLSVSLPPSSPLSCSYPDCNTTGSRKENEKVKRNYAITLRRPPSSSAALTEERY